MMLRIPKRRSITEQSLNLFIAGLVLRSIYIDLMASLAKVSGFDTKITTYIYYGLLWCLLLLSIPKIFRAITGKAVMGAAVVVAILACQYILFPENREYLMGTKTEWLVTFSPRTLMAVVPYMLIGIAVRDFEALRAILHKTARIGVIMGVISYAIAISKGHNIHYDDMENAYAVCIVVCLLLLDWRRGDSVFLAFGAFCLILAGTRGPLLCVMVAVILKTLFVETSTVKKLLKVTAGVVVAILLVFGLLEVLVELVADIFAVFGVTELRIVEYIRENMLLDSSGRDMITERVIEKIWDSPVMGYGVGGDRVSTHQEGYVHNVLLEMWVSYGIVMGTAFLVWMAYWIIKGIRNSDPAVQVITTALFSSTVVKLFLSSSYLYSKELFILLGLCISATFIQKRIKIQQPEVQKYE